MSPSIASFPSVLLISSILILLSTPNAIAAATPSSSPSLIQFACSDNSAAFFKPQVCVRLLESMPKIAAAKDLLSLSLAIIDAGISNSTNTQAYVKKALNHAKGGRRRMKGALQECMLAYDQVVERFGYARDFVKESEFSAATYELLTASTDFVKTCESALAKINVRDVIISRGNGVVPIFGLSAFTVVADLQLRSESPPPRPN